MSVSCVECSRPSEYPRALLCGRCYTRAYRRGARFRQPAQTPSCHPERKHCARGLCVPCYRKANYSPEVAQRKNREYDARYPGKRRASFLRWQKENPEKNRARRDQRRALEHNTPVCDFTLAQWQEIKRQHFNRCHYCFREAVLERDHVVPLSKGGSHTAMNIVPACRKCNNNKGNKDYGSFIQERGSVVGDVDRIAAA